MKFLELRCSECGAIIGTSSAPQLARIYCATCTMALQAVYKFLTGGFIVQLNLEIWTTNMRRKINAKDTLAIVLLELDHCRSVVKAQKEKPSVLKFKK